MNSSRKIPALRVKLLKKTIMISVIGFLAVSTILPYTLRKHDLEIIRYEMEKRAKLIRTGLLSTMMSTGNPEAIRGAVDSFKELREVKFSIYRSRYVLEQFGARDGETPTNKNVLDVLAGRVTKYENLSGNTFRYIVPYVSDKRCQKCHRDLNANPIPVGSVLGATEFVFDITERRNATLVLMYEILAAILVMLVALIFALYRMLAVNVLNPMKCITDNIAHLEKEKFDVACALICEVNQTREFDALVRQLRQMALILADRKKAREKELEDERKKIEQVRSFAMQRADSLGIKDESEITEIMNRLSRAVRDAEKLEMMRQVCEYVTCEKKELALSNSVELIVPTALYLTNLVACKNSVRKGAIELALEEAIANAMVHGNLETSSKLKEENYDKFDAQIAERAKSSPYGDRVVKISYSYSNEKAIFTVTDEGNGFDWKTSVNRKKEGEQLIYGRGMTIMKAFASSVEYNEKGNEVTLVFDTLQDSGISSEGE